MAPFGTSKLKHIGRGQQIIVLKANQPIPSLNHGIIPELSTCSDAVQRLKLGTVSRVNLARITTSTYCASFPTVGFLTLPLLVLAGIVLLVSSMVQAGGYLCTTARLSDLSMPHADLHFHVWIREYEVRKGGTQVPFF